MKVYSTSQVRELDRIAIEEHGIPGYLLMQQAGLAAFKLLRERYPRVQVLDIYCGPGNNGGDGYVIGALALQAGMDARVIQLGKAKKIRGDAALARNDYLDAQGAVTAFADSHERPTDVIVDAIFGTGLDRAPAGEFADAIQRINHGNVPVLAVDIPSGLNSDTGMAIGDTVVASDTATFIAMKQGLLTGSAMNHCGNLVLADLDLPQSIYRSITTHKTHLDHALLAEILRPRKPSSHKGDFGHVLLIGGAPGFSGSIRLTAEAALRAGAGLVTVATHALHVALSNLPRPEIMTVSTEHEGQLQQAIERATVIGIGPGLGVQEWSASLLKLALQSQKPVIADADALNLLAKEPIHQDKRILTPHPGEAARLLGVSNLSIQNDRYQAAEAIQKKYGGICVLKGAGTIIQSESSTSICTAGNPGMAGGGMGDTLTGIICALAAQQLSLQQAAEAGVLIHAMAADLAAAAEGQRGLLASDLFPFIRQLCNP